MYIPTLRRDALQRRFARPAADAQTRVRQMENALGDADPGVRLVAVQLLAKLGADAALTLVEAARDEDAHVRRKVMEALGRCGQQAIVVDALAQALADADAHVRMAAATSLREIGAPARTAIPALIGALADVNQIFARLAAQALSSLGRDAVPALSEALRSRDSSVRREAAWALGQIGAAAVGAVPALRELLDGEPASPATPVDRSNPLAATCILAIEPTCSDFSSRPAARPEANARVRATIEKAIERIQM
jgi:HEAT repeat protein